jgi:hypothetical protein
MAKLRKGKFGKMLNREELHSRFQGSFGHPSLIETKDALAKIEEIAGDNYINGHKNSHAQKVGRRAFRPGF